MHDTAKKLNTISEELNSYFLERRDLITAALITLLSGQHMFIVGLPGIAKSQAVRALVSHITNVRYFETALSRTRPVEAVLGPVDLKRLHEEYVYVLQREGYASMSDIIMLDEIGKMSSILGHDLLALLNERLIHEVRNGVSFHKSPLSSAFCPSNEMITGESDDAAALDDRLLVRCKVEDIEDPGNFAKLLLLEDDYTPQTFVEWEDLQHAIKVDVPAITISDAIAARVTRLRKEFREEHLHLSSRRWKASMKVLRAAAYLEGRDEVTEDDLHVLRWVLWMTTEQIDKVERLTMSASNPFVGRVFEIRAMLAEISDGITEREAQVPANATDQEKMSLMTYGGEANKKLGAARDQLDMLLLEAQGRPIPGFKVVSDTHESILVRNYMTCLGQPREVAEVAASKKLGSGDGGNK